MPLTYSGISNTPLHKHMLAKTMNEYSLPVVGLLGLLIRKGCGNQELSAAAEELSETLQKIKLGQVTNRVGVLIQIHDILLKSWTSTWKRTSPIEIKDPTEDCIALLTLDRDGSFKEPKHVTTIIAKFEYCMRLTFLREIRARAATSDESEACNGLEPWFTEKQYSTFARLRSLQHRASSIAFNTMSLPKIWWTDTLDWKTMLYKGEEICFDNVCEIFADTEAALVELWEQKILNGLSLRVEYDHIADDLTNKNVGYSFLSDPRNQSFHARDRLIQALVRGEGTFKQYTTVREGKIEWNLAAMRAWLQDYAEMERLLLLRAEMLSGSPGRGTELTAMTYRNTQTLYTNIGV
jgi:hypothetical protein